MGAGMVARYHAQAIAATPGARLVAVSRFDASKAAASAAEFGVPCETSDEALLARPDVDAVCICTPSGQHARETIAAARAGKHVLVEKPMALNLADADAMIEACRSAGVTLAVALQRRTEPAYQLVHQAIEAGHFGRPVLGMAVIPYFRSKAYYDSAVWRGTWKEDGGGALMNQGIHIADLLAWFMGDVEEVLARTGHDAAVCPRLPGWFLVWFVIALGLFCRDCYRQVFRWLQPYRKGGTPRRTTLCEARQRLGVAPMRLLAEQVIRLGA